METKLRNTQLIYFLKHFQVFSSFCVLFKVDLLMIKFMWTSAFQNVFWYKCSYASSYIKLHPRKLAKISNPQVWYRFIPNYSGFYYLIYINNFKFLLNVARLNYQRNMRNALGSHHQWKENRVGSSRRSRLNPGIRFLLLPSSKDLLRGRTSG